MKQTTKVINVSLVAAVMSSIEKTGIKGNKTKHERIFTHLYLQWMVHVDGSCKIFHSL
jgi:hypothetical protein